MIQTRHTYNIVDEPQNGTLVSMLAFCAERSTIALLVVREKEWLTDKARHFLMDAQPYLISMTETSEWPGTRLISGLATLYRFSLCPSFMELLNNAAMRLYAWQQPDLPEDLCFIRTDGTPIMVTIAHENDSYIELDEDEYRSLTCLAPAIRISQQTNATA